jgi:hypothetical protein
VIDRELTGHNRRAAAVAIIDDFEQVAALLRGRWGQPPVIEDRSSTRARLLRRRHTVLPGHDCVRPRRVFGSQQLGDASPGDSRGHSKRSARNHCLQQQQLGRACTGCDHVLGERAHAAFADIPVLGVDVVRETGGGRLSIMGVNPKGDTWHLSSLPRKTASPNARAGLLCAIRRT